MSHICETMKIVFNHLEIEIQILHNQVKVNYLYTCILRQVCIAMIHSVQLMKVIMTSIWILRVLFPKYLEESLAENKSFYSVGLVTFLNWISHHFCTQYLYFILHNATIFILVFCLNTDFIEGFLIVLRPYDHSFLICDLSGIV